MGQRSSRIFATQFIPAGEEITVSYLYPIERAFVCRQRLLNTQFLFTCRCNLCRHETRLRADQECQGITTCDTMTTMKERNLPGKKTITSVGKDKKKMMINEKENGHEVNDELEAKKNEPGKRNHGILADVAAIRRERVLVRVEEQIRTKLLASNGTTGKRGRTVPGEWPSGDKQEKGMQERGEGNEKERDWRSYHFGPEFHDLTSMRGSLVSSLAMAYQQFTPAEMSALRCSLARVDRSMVRCVRGMLHEIDHASSHAKQTNRRKDIPFLLYSLLESLLSLRCFETRHPIHPIMDGLPVATTAKASKTNSSSKRKKKSLSLSTAHTLANLSNTLRRAIAGTTGTTGLGDQNMISMLFTLRRHPWEELKKEEEGSGQPKKGSDDERKGPRPNPSSRADEEEDNQGEEGVTGSGYTNKDLQWFSSLESIKRCIDTCDSGARSIAALYDREMKRLV